MSSYGVIGMIVLVCGSRSWSDAKTIRDRLAQLPPGTLILTGDARGADCMVYAFSRVLRLKVDVFPADWRRYPKRAGILRNLEMLAHDPDLVIAFWDGSSRGTKHVIDEATQRGIPTEIHRDVDQ